MTYTQIVIVFLVCVIGFIWGFYLGCVHGAVAWRRWALGEQAKRKAAATGGEE